MDFVPTVILMYLFIIYVYVHGHIYCIYVHLFIIMHTLMYVYRWDRQSLWLNLPDCLVRLTSSQKNDSNAYSGRHSDGVGITEYYLNAFLNRDTCWYTLLKEGLVLGSKTVYLSHVS